MLGRVTERDIWSIYKSGSEQEPDFEKMVHSDQCGIAQKMVWRFRGCGDVVFFWNNVPSSFRSGLLSWAGIYRDELKHIGLKDLDFFVWLANTHIEWEDRKPRKKPIGLFFEVSDEQRRAWIEEYDLLNAEFEK